MTGQAGTAPGGRLSPGVACGLIVLAIVCAQALAVWAMNHPLICACGHVDFWYANPAGPETSQHVTDWYTFTHVVHGILFYLVLTWLMPRRPLGQRFVAAVLIEALWEFAENTPIVLDRYRQQALAQGYYGDSVLNSLADTGAMALGFLLASRVSWKAAIAVTLALELFLAFMIRDNLLLNIIQLIRPSEMISQWQLGQ